VRRRVIGRLVLGAAAAITATAALMRTVVRRRRAAAAQARRGVSCGCGVEYEVAGTDRHRIYWQARAPHGAPLLGDYCLVCEAPLPTEHEAAAA
jgi:hypothetical protein